MVAPFGFASPGFAREIQGGLWGESAFDGFQSGHGSARRITDLQQAPIFAEGTIFASEDKQDKADEGRASESFGLFLRAGYVTILNNLTKFEAENK